MEGEASVYQVSNPVPCATARNSSFIKTFLQPFAKAHPAIEFAVSPRPRKHPIMVGHYVNGRHKSICVKNMEPSQILKKAELLRDSSGEVAKRYSKPVTSVNPSVRGIWSPYHGKGMPV